MGELGNGNRQIDRIEQGRDAIRSELKMLALPRHAKVRDTDEIRAELTEYLKTWLAMAREGVAEARRLLRAVLVGRFVFTPVARPPEFARTERPWPEAALHLRIEG